MLLSLLLMVLHCSFLFNSHFINCKKLLVLIVFFFYRLVEDRKNLHETLIAKERRLKDLRLRQPKERFQDVEDEIEALKANIKYVEDNITECQQSILQLEESKVSFKHFCQEVFLWQYYFYSYKKVYLRVCCCFCNSLKSSFTFLWIIIIAFKQYFFQTYFLMLLISKHHYIHYTHLTSLFP